jgi:putative endonuclease
MRQETMDRRKLGRRGEWVALVLLLLKGYRPRHRNWRGAGGEVDLVVERRQEIVFVEVKARSSALFGGAVGAVDAKKQKKLARVSSAYLSRFGLWDRPCRFDIITIERTREFPYWRINHYANAFSPDLGRLL